MRFLMVCFFAMIPISSYALINGVSLNNGNPDVVRLIFKNKWVCTGTFLDEYTILTAAHCVYGSEASALDLVVTEDDKKLDVSQITTFYHPHFEENAMFPSHDIGIIKTSRNALFKGGFVMENIPTGLFGSITLYGCGKVSADEDKRARTTGSNRFINLNSTLIFFGRSKSSTSSPGSFTSIAPNDSGGPILSVETGKVIGISTNTTAKKSFAWGLPTINTGPSLTEESNLQFIHSHLGSKIN